MTNQPTAASQKPALTASATGSRRLTILYIVALSTVALLTIGAQVLVQWQLESSQTDSRVINIAGRQRMLSQRLAKSSLQLEADSEENDPAVRQEMASALEEWQSNHNGLQHGDRSNGLEGDLSPQLTKLFAEVRPHYEAIRLAAQKQIIAKPGDDVSASVRDIREHESAFLEGMDNIVSRCVLEAEGRVARLRNSELALLALTLLVLVAEGLFIFKPAVRQIKQIVARLEATGARLTVAKEEAESANEAKTRFLANVSHELRTPMTAVLGMTELARESTDPERRDQYLTIVEQAGQSLLRLLNDLIDTAKIEAAELELRETPFNPVAVNRRVVELLRPLAAAKGLDIQCKHDDVADSTVLGDEERLMQVLINLVGNAIKYTDAGHVCATLETLASGAGNRRLVWTISDTGIGINSDDQARLFEPFFQVEASPEASRGGAGLGLSICAKILDALGGSIDISSTVGKGTTVRVEIELPLATMPDASPKAASLPSEQSAASLNVLVVEDSSVNQLLLKEWLERAGHRVTIAEDGAKAIEAFETRGADVVVTDYRLGPLNGAETALRLREIAAVNHNPAPPIICVTGDVDATASFPGQDIFDAVAMKPVGRVELYRLIEKATSTNGESGTAVADDSMPDFHRELAVELSRIMPRQLDDLQEAMASRDFTTVSLLSHRMRGQVAYFNCPDTERTLLQLEQAAELCDYEVSQAHVGKLQVQLAELLRTLLPTVAC
jgi:signal transduction histidine kinase/DNA-binding response OmpR family regulator